MITYFIKDNIAHYCSLAQEKLREVYAYLCYNCITKDFVQEKDSFDDAFPLYLGTLMSQKEFHGLIGYIHGLP